MSAFEVPDMMVRQSDGEAGAVQTATSRAARPNGLPSDRSRILVVEDQDDVRRMLVTALEFDGHAVDEAASAAGGLQRLQQARYDLVLTDYAMPGGTGTWMLHEASRRGLMDRTLALIVTAHPDVRDLATIEVITKPLDLDMFLAQVRQLLGGGGTGSGGQDPGGAGGYGGALHPAPPNSGQFHFD